MRKSILFLAALLALIFMSIAQTGGAVAQTTGPEQVTKTLPATPTAKDLEGKDAFSSDGQQVGKVTKVEVLADGNVKAVEIQSSGFLGFFSTTYVVPVDKVSVKGGRVDVSMTSDQVKKLTR
jgi:sporulation protein YlmC with PRC-barrel domain